MLMLAEQAVEAVKEAAQMPTTADLMEAVEHLGFLILALAVLMLLLGIFVTRGQRRIARNQIELAELMRGSGTGGEG